MSTDYRGIHQPSLLSLSPEVSVFVTGDSQYRILSQVFPWVEAAEIANRYRAEKVDIQNGRVLNLRAHIGALIAQSMNGWTDRQTEEMVKSTSWLTNFRRSLEKENPNEQTFDETKLIFENLSTLRPSVLQTLLEDCSSIKVKRLFFYFAEESGHAWFKKINASKIDLGSEKRAIVPKGRLNLKYQILIPRES